MEGRRYQKCHKSALSLHPNYVTAQPKEDVPASLQRIDSGHVLCAIPIQWITNWFQISKHLCHHVRDFLPPNSIFNVPLKEGYTMDRYYRGVRLKGAAHSSFAVYKIWMVDSMSDNNIGWGLILLPANFLMLCRDPLDGFSVLIPITWIFLRSTVA